MQNSSKQVSKTITDEWREIAHDSGFTIKEFKIGDGQVSFSAIVDVEMFIPSEYTDSQKWQILDNTSYTCNCNPKKGEYEARKDDVDLWLTSIQTHMQFAVRRTRVNMEYEYIRLCTEFSKYFKTIQDVR